jgi:hypothetical protein
MMSNHLISVPFAHICLRLLLNPTMYKSPKSFLFPWKGSKGLLFITLPQVLLLVVVIGLLVYTVLACMKFTRRSLTVTALRNQLLLLQGKFVHPFAMDPDVEREQMEILHNNLKTSSDATQITANSDLKQLIQSTCLSIKSILNKSDLVNKTGWIKFNRVMSDFDDLYFQ